MTHTRGSTNSRVCVCFLVWVALCVAQALMTRIKRDNAAVEQLTLEAKQLQAQVKQLEARQGAAAAATAAASAGSGGSGVGSVLDDPAKR